MSQLSGDLHGDGTTSYVFVLRSAAASRDEGFHGPSDRLFILDDDGGGIKVAFEFQPAGLVASPSEIRRASRGLDLKQARLTKQALTEPNPYFARVDGLYDATGGGVLDIVGSWNSVAMGQDIYPRPFVISWNAAHQRYSQTPVLASREDVKYSLAKVSKPGDIGRLLRSGYVDNVAVLRDRSTGAIFRSLDVDDYSIAMRKGHAVLVAAYVLRATAFAFETLWQAVPYSLADSGELGPALGGDCSYGHPIFMRPNLDAYIPGEAALAAWRASPSIDKTYC